MNIIKSSVSDLLATLGKVASIVPSRAVIPALANILIHKVGDSHKFTGSDSDVQIEATGSFGGDEGMATTTVQAAKLLSLLKSMPADQVVTLAMDGAKMTLKSGRSKFTLQTLDSAAFPTFREDPTIAGFEVDGATLAKLIDQTSYAIDDGNAKPFFNGALFELQGSQFTVVGSNGYCMAVGRKTIEQEGSASVIMPRKSVLELRRLLDGVGSVKASLSLNHARFEFGNVVFLTRLIGAKYPDYTRVLAQTSEANSATVNRAGLLAMLKRALLITKEGQKSPGVRFKFAPGVLTLLAQTNAEEGEQDCDFSYDGPEFVLGLPILQMMNGLTAFSDDLVRLAFAPDKPMLMKFDSDPYFAYCVMPMRI